MTKRVLLAVDLNVPDNRSASYAVQLAARLKLSLVLMAVFPPQAEGGSEPAEISLEGLQEEQRLWLGMVRERCQREGVRMEIFISSGPFCDEVLRFARAQSSLQFIVLGWPEDFYQRKKLECSAVLKSMDQQIEGEILVVRSQGKVTRLMDL